MSRHILTKQKQSLEEIWIQDYGKGIGFGDTESGLKGMGFVWFDLNNIATKYNMERP